MQKADVCRSKHRRRRVRVRRSARFAELVVGSRAGSNDLAFRHRVSSVQPRSVRVCPPTMSSPLCSESSCSSCKRRWLALAVLLWPLPWHEPAASVRYPRRCSRANNLPDRSTNSAMRRLRPSTSTSSATRHPKFQARNSTRGLHHSRASTRNSKLTEQVRHQDRRGTRSTMTPADSSNGVARKWSASTSVCQYLNSSIESVPRVLS